MRCTSVLTVHALCSRLLFTQILADLLRGDTDMYDSEGFVKRSAGGFVNVLPSAKKLEALKAAEEAKVLRGFSP